MRNQLICAATLVSSLLGAAFCAHAADIRMPHVTAPVGTTVDIPVSVSQLSGLQGYSFTVTYPSTQLDFVSAEQGTLTAAWTNFTSNPGSAKVSVASAGLTGVSGSGPIALLKFRIRSGVATGTVMQLAFQQADLNDGGIPATKVSGSIKVDASTTMFAPTQQFVAKNVTVGVPIGITSNSNAQSFFIELAYNPAVLTYNGVNPGSLNGTTTVTSNPQTGKVLLAWANEAPLTGTGSIAIVNFTVPSGVSYGTVSALIIERADLNDGELELNPRSGRLNVGPCWANFAYVGTELGSQSQPYNTLAEAMNACTSGAVIRIQYNAADFTTSEKPRITKALRIEANGGTVRIGVNGGKRTVDGKVSDEKIATASDVPLLLAGVIARDGTAIESGPALSLAEPSRARASVPGPNPAAEVPPTDAPLRPWLTIGTCLILALAGVTMLRRVS